MSEAKPQVVIIAGQNGAGKSVCENLNLRAALNTEPEAVRLGLSAKGAKCNSLGQRPRVKVHDVWKR